MNFNFRTSSGIRALGRMLTSVNKIEVDSQRNYHEATGDVISPGLMQGMDHIRNPRLNKVMVYFSFIYKYYKIHYFFTPIFIQAIG